MAYYCIDLINVHLYHYIDGLAQERCNSSALAMELRFFLALTLTQRDDAEKCVDSFFLSLIVCPVICIDFVKHLSNILMK